VPQPLYQRYEFSVTNPAARLPAMTTLFFNGKFTAQATTGVQRVATQLLLALDRQLMARPSGSRWVLLCPPGSPALPLQALETRVVAGGFRPLHLWEQLSLPRAARGGCLVSLAGSSPWTGTGQVCMLNDAAVFDQPAAYTRPFGLWYRSLFRRQARQAALLLTPSAAARSQLLKWLPVAPGRIQVLRPGADHFRAVLPDPSVIDRHGLRGQRYLLAVGSANPNKNLARLVEAFLALPESLADVRLVIVGGSNRRVFAGQPSGPGRQQTDDGRVVHAGALPDAALKTLYEQAQALVFPSLYEGFGLPPLEAMQCGCPVLASRIPAVEEACGDHPLYFDATSTAAMTEVMARALGDPAALVGRRERGRAHAMEWRWDDAAAALRDLLERHAGASP
jgi:hypothetical protein